MQGAIRISVFHLRQWLGMLRRALRPRHRPDGRPLRLHLGCGSIDHPGFVNVDGIDRPHVHFVQSIARLGRFGDGCAEFVYSSHTLEHFPREDTLAVLREWRRVLAPGGRLCLSVPDFDRILQIYQASGQDVSTILAPLFGGQDYPFNFHYTSFTARSLGALLREAGFSAVEHWEYGCDAWHNLPDWSGRTIQVNGQAIPISLNLQATR